MTTFEPGRVYSGIIDGKRRLLFCGEDRETEFSWVNDHGMLRFSPKSGVDDPTDIRGPLVVLDLEGTGWTWGRLVSRLRADDFHSLADQIEEQTRPPLQIGWHEVEGNAMPRYWNGSEWMLTRTNMMPTAQDWTSTHFIGPAGGES